MKKSFVERFSGQCTIVTLGIFTYAVFNAERVSIQRALKLMPNSSDPPFSYNGIEGGLTEYSLVNVTGIPSKLGEKQWDPETRRLVITAGFAGYVSTLTMGGMLADVLGANSMLWKTIFFSSFCTMCSTHIAYHHYKFFMIIQFSKGVAQAFIQTALYSLMAKWFNNRERTSYSAVMYSGIPMGAMTGIMVSDTLSDMISNSVWYTCTIFWIYGILGLFLSLLEWIFVYNSPEQRAKRHKLKVKPGACRRLCTYKMKREAPWRKMVLSIPTWALIAGLSGQFYMVEYLTSISPEKLCNDTNYTDLISIHEPFMQQCLQMFIISIVGIFSKNMIELNSANIDTVRKGFNTLSAVLFTFIVSLRCFYGYNMAFILLTITSTALGIVGSGSVRMDMTRKFAGSLAGITSTMGIMIGLSMTVVKKYIAGNEDSFMNTFLSLFFVITCAALFHIYGSAESQGWDYPPPPTEKDNEKKDEDNTLKIALV